MICMRPKTYNTRDVYDSTHSDFYIFMINKCNIGDVRTHFNWFNEFVKYYLRNTNLRYFLAYYLITVILKIVYMKRYLPIILLIFLFSLSGCDYVFNCILGVKPKLKEKTLDQGFVSAYYTETITARIKAKNNTDFSFYFDILGLPAGLEVSSEGNPQTVTIKGVPRESGQFSIEVFLKVSGTGEEKLCSDKTSKFYTLTIK